MAIPVHDCADLLERCLPQVVDELGNRDDVEIVVVDDASTDHPETVVERLGAGRVRYVRNPCHLGASGTFNRCIALTEGDLVHILHGDDAVLPGFYRAMERALTEHPWAVAAMCRTQYVDEDDRPGPLTRRYRKGTGVWRRALRAEALSNRVRPPGIVVRRSGYAAVGSFRTDLPHAADWDMWVRLLTTGPLVFVDEVLACYRRHSRQDTTERVRTGANIRERVEAVSVIAEHMPRRERGVVTRGALAYSTVFAARTAMRLASSHEWSAATGQLHEAVHCVLRLPVGVPRPRVTR